MCQQKFQVHSPSLIWNLKNDDFQVRNLLFQGTIFRFHVHQGWLPRNPPWQLQQALFFCKQAFMLGAWVETTHERGYFEGFLVLKYDSSHGIYWLWVSGTSLTPQRRWLLCVEEPFFYCRRNKRVEGKLHEDFFVSGTHSKASH